VKAEILAIGTELLMGQIVNTNARFISEKFPMADVYVYYHTVVGDNETRIKECLLNALERVDVVITTGGLGPTQDDITKEIVSKVFNKKLILDKNVLAKIENFFKSRNKVMSSNNIRQAYFPKDSTIIENGMGTAPGCMIEKDNKIVIMLPGPPSEMQPMFMDYIIPYFKEKSSVKLYSKFIKLFGIGESEMEEKIKGIIKKQKNPTIAPYAKQGEITLRVTAKYNEKKQDKEKIINPTIKKINEKLGEYIYSFDNEKLIEVLFKRLISNKITVSFAESCTGGLLSKRLTDISGASNILNSSYITYTNQSKVKILDVKEETLKKYGAVSKQVAIEMVKGLLKITNSDLVLSITGIAGPTGGTKDKPVGLTYLALGYKGKIVTKRLKLWGNRDRIRNVACLNAMDFILKNI